MLDNESILKMQTGLDRKTLIALIRGDGGGHRKCLLVNDLNILFWRGDEEAEEVLCDLIQDPATSVESKYAAYAGLASRPFPSQRVEQALEEFRAKPENKALVEDGEKKISIVRKLLVQLL